jgi:hypothetical protein
MLQDHKKDCYVHPYEVMEMIENEDIMYLRDGQSAQDVYSAGIMLSLDENIHYYKQGILDPHEPVESFFTKVKIKDGFFAHESRFFLSSSKEYIRIPPGYVGMIHVTDYQGMQYLKTGPTGTSRMFVHANAPKIDPVPCFEGKITFECLPFTNAFLQKGDWMNNMVLYKLDYPIKHHTSRYKGQHCTENSKAHLK